MDVAGCTVPVLQPRVPATMEVGRLASPDYAARACRHPEHHDVSGGVPALQIMMTMLPEHQELDAEQDESDAASFSQVWLKQPLTNCPTPDK